MIKLHARRPFSFRVPWERPEKDIHAERAQREYPSKTERRQCEFIAVDLRLLYSAAAAAPKSATSFGMRWMARLTNGGASGSK